MGANTKSSEAPRSTRRTIMAAARRVHGRDGAETFSLAHVAAEAGVSADTVAAHFQTKQELLLAIAADDLASLAGAMREDGGITPSLPPAQTAARADADGAPREEPGRLIRKKVVMPPVLDQLMKEVAPEPDTGGGSLARLERRIYVLERAFADIVERHEKSLRERQDAVTATEENVGALRQRLDAAERSHAATIADLHGAMKAACNRLAMLEHATPVVPASAQTTAAIEPGIEMPAVIAPAEEIAAGAPAGADAEPPPVQAETDCAETIAEQNSAEQNSMGEESYLSAARRAAIEAHRAETASDMRGSRAAAKAGRGKNRLKFLIFGCAAPAVILATAIMVLNRHTVTAEPAPQQVSPLPQVVVAPPADPTPAQLTVTQPLEKLTALAQMGDASAMRDIGLKYLAGDNVPVNEAESARWLLQAAYKGEPTAEYWLGTLYARGHGVPADAFQANHWYEASAKQGNRRAMHSFAVANFQGWGVEKNFPVAMKWFTQAAELGFRDSQFNLAVMYERGSGVPQNLAEAYKWYAVAAANGDKESESRLAILAGQLKPADLALAQHAAVGFKPAPLNQSANLANLPKQLPGG